VTRNHCLVDDLLLGRLNHVSTFFGSYLKQDGYFAAFF
jgi:hypothetical protein